MASGIHFTLMEPAILKPDITSRLVALDCHVSSIRVRRNGEAHATTLGNLSMGRHAQINLNSKTEDTLVALLIEQDKLFRPTTNSAQKLKSRVPQDVECLAKTAFSMRCSAPQWRTYPESPYTTLDGLTGNDREQILSSRMNREVAYRRLKTDKLAASDIPRQDKRALCPGP